MGIRKKSLKRLQNGTGSKCEVHTGITVVENPTEENYSPSALPIREGIF